MNEQVVNTGFDEVAADRAKRTGMMLAAGSTKNSVLVRVARRAMEFLSAMQGEVTVDDVRLWLTKNGYGAYELGNSMGSVFKARGWRPTGEMVKSTFVTNHAHLVRVWVFEGKQ